MIQINKKYNYNKFELIGVLRTKEKDNIKSYTKLFELKTDLNWIQVFSDDLYKYFNVSGIPRLVLLSPKGEILNIDSDQLRLNLNEILDEVMNK